ncbi:MAG: DUF5522 domain-containing protein [Candidatus Kapabacteria bacterium]|nr:DUF5522 domain-containing protein [Candidatus Kapabacteria bacterium]
MLNDAPDKKISDLQKSLNDDFYFNQDGLLVFTENYHRKRGFCCKNSCLHCPWNYRNSQKVSKNFTTL